MDGLEVVRGLMARGYSAPQAAALAGHVLQESGANPAAVNPKEDAHGLLQWEGPRWDALQGFAKSQGKSPTDPDIQMDFIKSEMNGPEAKSSAAFMSAPDVSSASAALKNYVRFGDDSAPARLANANDLFTQLNGAAPSAAPQVGALAAPTAAPATPAPAAPTFADKVGALGKTFAGNPDDSAAPLQNLLPLPSNAGQSQQIAAAIAQRYGLGGFA